MQSGSPASTRERIMPRTWITKTLYRTSCYFRETGTKFRVTIRERIVKATASSRPSPSQTVTKRKAIEMPVPMAFQMYVPNAPPLSRTRLLSFTSK